MEAVDVALYSDHSILLPPDHTKGKLVPTSAVPTDDPRAETLLVRAAAAENCCCCWVPPLVPTDNPRAETLLMRAAAAGNHLNLKLCREGRVYLHQSRSSRQRRGNMFQLSV